jgi:methylmalonyl-CoA mutase
LLMSGESHLDLVADPASGSGSVEALTEQLCQAAWREFQTIDGEGGILKSLLDGRIQNRIAGAERQRVQLFRDGKRQIVGSTIYPPSSERPVETLSAATRPVPTEGAVYCERMTPHRIEQSLGVKS